MIMSATIRDAIRYRRLRILGCAPGGTKQLDQGSVLCFQNLDDFVDADLVAHPHRGEARERDAAPTQDRAAVEECLCVLEDDGDEEAAKWHGAITRMLAGNDVMRAFIRGEVARAEALMREHANVPHIYNPALAFVERCRTALEDS